MFFRFVIIFLDLVINFELDLIDIVDFLLLTSLLVVERKVIKNDIGVFGLGDALKFMLAPERVNSRFNMAELVTLRFHEQLLILMSWRHLMRPRI
jgi:hypothetical protein